MGPDKHTLTRDSQEVRELTEVEAKILKDLSLSGLPSRLILVDAIPHCGQLNITTSTLLTGVSVTLKSKMTLIKCCVVCIVSS